MIEFRCQEPPTKEEIEAIWKKRQVARFGECKSCGWWPRPMGIIQYEKGKYFCGGCGEQFKM